MTASVTAPADWVTTTLGAICAFENGDRGDNYPSPDSFVSTGVPFVNAGHLRSGRIAFDDMDYISDRAFSRLGGGKFGAGDILFCLRGSLGKFGVVRSKDPLGAIASSLVILRPKRQQVLTGFLAAFLESEICSQQIDMWAGGAAQPNLGAGQLARFAIKLPPICEQARMSDVITTVEDLITTLERLIVKKQAIKQGMMQQLLTGKIRLPGFTAPWREVTVGDLTDQHRQTVDPRKDRRRRFQHFSLPAFDDGAVPVRTFGEAIDSIKFVVPTDAVLVSKLNPRIPRIWAPDEIGPNAIASTEFIVLTPRNGTSRSFLNWLMKSDPVVSPMKLLATGTTGSHARIHPKQVAAIEVHVPAEDEQVSIAEVLDEADREIHLLRQRLTKARMIKSGMMQELLTGRTRLPIEQEAA